MNWRNVWLIFHREVADQLRDRRTLFMVTVLPILLYPAMGIGLVNMLGIFSEQPRTVVVLGSDQLPPPPLLTGPLKNRFNGILFADPQTIDMLDVTADAVPQEALDELTKEELQRRKKLLSQARKIRVKLELIVERQQELDRLREAADELETSAGSDKQITKEDAEALAEENEIEIRREELEQAKSQLADLFSQSDIQVLVVVPENFATIIEEQNRRFADRIPDDESPPATAARPILLRNSADDKSFIAFERVRHAFREWEDAILRQRLVEVKLPVDFAEPVKPQEQDVAEADQIAANVWSKLFPALLIIMCITGAFYPAIDLGAGEKERGTMETLLICPASRTEIVIGKFFTVLGFSITTALLNLASMGLTGQHIINSSGMGGRMSEVDFTLPGFSSLIWVVVLALPLTSLFSALSLAFAIFARSTKEGQYYLTPLLLITTGITMFCMYPAAEINTFNSVMPVMGPALLLKALLSGGPTPQLLIYVLPVLITSFGYSYFALLWAIDQFKREDVLFREAERFELGLWVRHLLRDKEPVPSFAEAGFCFLLMMLLQFFLLNVFGKALENAGDLGLTMIRLIIIQQLVLIACPALFMAILLTTDIRATLRLYWPGWKAVALGAALPLFLHPPVRALQELVTPFFPPLPPGAERIFGMLGTEEIPIFHIILGFALAPAICEEIAFRGFIMRGLESSKRIGLAILLSSIAFGVIHMIPIQSFFATLLGLVLGLLAYKTNSLLPGVVFHFVHNSLAAVHQRIDWNWTDHTIWRSFVESGPEASMSYSWLTILLFGAVAVYLLLLLAKWGEQDQQSVAPNVNTYDLSEPAVSTK